MPTILFADDEPAMRAMVARVLEEGGHQVRLARNGREALEQVRSSLPDLVVLDYQMGQPDGFQVCRDLKNNPRFGHVPVLILTGRGSLDVRLEGYDAGADDYLAKPFDPRELLARVSALLRLASRGLQRNPTSGLPGGEAIHQEFARWHQRGAMFAVCYLDLDDFKPFGDRFGFRVADDVIRAAGEELRDLCSDTDAFVGHIGGDDFLLICLPEEARRLSEAAQARMCERILAFVPPAVARVGYYEAEARDGTLHEFPLTRLSAAIVRIAPGSEISLVELGETVARVKRLAKRSGGNGIAEVEIPL